MFLILFMVQMFAPRLLGEVGSLGLAIAGYAASSYVRAYELAHQRKDVPQGDLVLEALETLGGALNIFVRVLILLAEKEAKKANEEKKKKK